MIYYSNIIVAVVAGLLFLPFWFLQNHTFVPGLQMIVNVILLPILLVILDIILLFKGKVNSYLILYLAVPLSCLISQTICYINWGVSSGNLLKPDDETVLLTKSFVLISLGIALSLIIVCHLALKLTKKI